MDSKSDRRKRMITLTHNNGVSSIREIDVGSVLRPRQVNELQNSGEMHRKRALSGITSPTCGGNTNNNTSNASGYRTWRDRKVPPPPSTGFEAEEIFTTNSTTARTATQRAPTPTTTTTAKKRSISTPGNTPAAPQQHNQILSPPGQAPSVDLEEHRKLQEAVKKLEVQVNNITPQAPYTVKSVKRETHLEVRESTLFSPCEPSVELEEHQLLQEKVRALESQVKLSHESVARVRENFKTLQAVHEQSVYDIEALRDERETLAIRLAEGGEGEHVKYFAEVEKNAMLEEKVRMLEEGVNTEGIDDLKIRLVSVIKKSFEEKEEMKRKIFALESQLHRDTLDHQAQADDLQAKITAYVTEIAVLKDFRSNMRISSNSVASYQQALPDKDAADSNSATAAAIGLTPPTRPAALRTLPVHADLLP